MEYRKPYNKKPYQKTKWAFEIKPEVKFDVDTWLRQNQNIEYPKRGKKNTLEKRRKK